MDFIYKEVSELNKSALYQGDVIARTDEVVERVRQANQYYADAPDYSHFVVLTQSCDLVKRNDDFKASYLTIAAAKPFKTAMNSYFKRNSKLVEGAKFTYHSSSLKGRAKQLVERHINNTEPEFFFLPSTNRSEIKEDLLVFLRLTIALRKEHYDALAQAKIAELADVFQAKLGWLKGNIYSRVATPDIEELTEDASRIKQNFYDRYVLKDNLTWLSGFQSELLRKIVKERRQKYKRDLTRDEVQNIIDNEIPDDKDIVAANIVETLRKRGLIADDQEDIHKQFAKVIAKESSSKSLVKSADH